MNLSQLRAIVAIADCGSFSEAALSLDVSQSSVSHAIASLEDELGVPLFVRGRHGAILTPAGARITDHARQALQSIDLMQQEADRHKHLQGGEIRIAAPRSVATHVLPSIMAQFCTRYPSINLTIVECFDPLQVEQLLRESRADIGFVYLPVSDDLQTLEVMQEEYVVLLPPQARLSQSPLTWEELATFPVILPDHTPLFAALYHHLASFAPPLKIAYKINYGTTIVGMVNQGLGMAILPRLAAEPIPPTVQVQRLPVPLVRTLAAAVRSDVLQVPAVFVFLDLLKQGTQPLIPNPQPPTPNPQPPIPNP
jgi:DNA-binding transcriptional LysR family regulator